MAQQTNSKTTNSKTIAKSKTIPKTLQIPK